MTLPLPLFRRPTQDAPTLPDSLLSRTLFVVSFLGLRASPARLVAPNGFTLGAPEPLWLARPHPQTGPAPHTRPAPRPQPVSPVSPLHLLLPRVSGPILTQLPHYLEPASPNPMLETLLCLQLPLLGLGASDLLSRVTSTPVITF